MSALELESITNQFTREGPPPGQRTGAFEVAPDDSCDGTIKGGDGFEGIGPSGRCTEDSTVPGADRGRAPARAPATFRIVAWSGADHSKYWTKANMVAYSNPQLIVRNELRPHTIERRDVLAGKFEA